MAWLAYPVRVPLTYSPWMLTRNCGLVVSRDPQARRGVAILAGVVDPDEREEVGLLSYWGGGEEYVCTLGHLLGYP